MVPRQACYVTFFFMQLGARELEAAQQRVLLATFPLHAAHMMSRYTHCRSRRNFACFMSTTRPMPVRRIQEHQILGDLPPTSP